MNQSPGRFAKKSLGQNFLSDQTVIQKISDAIPEETPLLLEIGPGRGALTFKIFERAKKFCVIEKDDTLVESIRRELSGLGKGDFVWHGDALEFPYGEIWERTKSSVDTPLTIAGNLPYNVATEILLRLLPLAERIERMVLMFQKEVGERLGADSNTKAYGSLSILAQNWYDVKKLMIVKPGAFKPAPKVDSIVLTFVRRPKPQIDLSDRERFLRFEKLIRSAFAYRRKTVENSLKIAQSHRDWKKVLAEAGIEGKRRAETISIAEFKTLLEVTEKLDPV